MDRRAFSLIEVLMTMLVFAIGGIALLEFIISVNEKAIKLEIESMAEHYAVEALDSIKTSRLSEWNGPLAQNISSVEKCFAYDGQVFMLDSNNQYITSDCTGINSVDTLRTKCTSVSDLCTQVGTYPTSGNELFYRVISIKNVSPWDDTSKIVTVYIGCISGCNTFVKFQTIVSKLE